MSHAAAACQLDRCNATVRSCVARDEESMSNETTENNHMSCEPEQEKNCEPHHTLDLWTKNEKLSFYVRVAIDDNGVVIVIVAVG